MGEGEFKKRIREIIRQRQLVDPNYVDTYLRMLDEAFKEFPMWKEEKFKQQGNPEGIFIDAIRAEAWFVKWFGDRGKDVRSGEEEVNK